MNGHVIEVLQNNRSKVLDNLVGGSITFAQWQCSESFILARIEREIHYMDRIYGPIKMGRLTPDAPFEMLDLAI